MSDNYPTVGSTEEDYGFSGTAAVPAGATFPTGTTGTTGTTSSSTSGTTTGMSDAADTAKEQAGHLKDETVNAGQKVAGTAKEEATKVASEVKTQAKDLFAQTKSELSEQAGTQQKRVASGLHSISDELSGMASNSGQSGIASDLVGQAASRAGSIATWLEARDPGSLLDEVRSYARRSPGTFIAIAAVAGVLAGRLTRSVVSSSADAAKEAAAEADATPRSYNETHTGYSSSDSTFATPIHDSLNIDGIDSSRTTSGDYR